MNHAQEVSLSLEDRRTLYLLTRSQQLRDEADRARAKEAADAARQQLYDRAAAAAQAWRGGKRPTDQQRAWQRHVVDLAAAEPALEIVWLRRGAQSTGLILPVGGVASIATKRLIVPPIMAIEDLMTAMHEIGHHRSDEWLSAAPVAKRRGTGGNQQQQAPPIAPLKLKREMDAWAWARHHAPLWDEPCQEDMTKSLKAYVADAGWRDIEVVLSVERFCSFGAFAAERQRRAEMESTRDRLKQHEEMTRFANEVRYGRRV